MRSKRKRLRRYLLIGLGLPIFLIAVFVGFLAYKLSPSRIDYQSETHPFKNVEVQRAFLANYDKRAERWPVPSTTQLVATSYGQTHIKVSGPEDGPVMVLLHGMGGNLLLWEPNIAQLSEQFRVYAIDTPHGDGRSIASRAMHQTEDYRNWLAELFRKLELGVDTHLVGISYGGWIAAQFAISHSDQLSSVSLLAPAGIAKNMNAVSALRAVQLFLPGLQSTRSFFHWIAEDSVKKGNDHKSLINEQADEFYAAIRSFSGKAIARPAKIESSRLNNLNIPVMLLIGENEKLFDAGATIAWFKDVAPNVASYLIPAAGHDLTFAQTQLVNRYIVDFASGK